jgi:hypothetical protein
LLAADLKTSRLTLRRVGRWTGIVLLGLVALIMWLAASGAAYEAIMAAGDDERYPARGQRVDVGGYGCTFTASGKAAPPLCSMPGWVGFRSTGASFNRNWLQQLGSAHTTALATAGATPVLSLERRAKLSKNSTRCSSTLISKVRMCWRGIRRRANTYASTPIGIRTMQWGWCWLMLATKAWMPTARQRLEPLSTSSSSDFSGRSGLQRGLA